MKKKRIDPPWLPDDCLGLIFSFAAPRESLRKLLRLVCRRWGELGKVAFPRADCLNDPFPVRLLLDSAREGSVGWCAHAWDLVRTELSGYDESFLNFALQGAARHGNAAVCFWARAEGARKWKLMAFAAAGGGSEEICALAKEWGCPDFSLVAVRAAGTGRLGLCEILRSWTLENAPDNRMALRLANRCLMASAGRGSAEVAKKALEWGAKALDPALEVAIREGEGKGEVAEVLMRRMEKGGVRGMALAAEYGNVEIWNIAKRLGVREYYQSLVIASSSERGDAKGREEIRRMSRESGASLPDFFFDAKKK